MDSLRLPTYRESHSRRYHPYPRPPRSRGIQVADGLVRHLNYQPPFSPVFCLIVVATLLPHQRPSPQQDEDRLFGVGEDLFGRDENGRGHESEYDTREIRSDAAQHGSQEDAMNLERALGLEPGQQRRGFVALVLDLATAVRGAISRPAIVLKAFFSFNTDDVLAQ
ncbi:hypothetical protein FKP32DRAFT_1591454 [Trametes sanguinea]|nr:hypothetical protein FKP32DRAFT_1591454 [Trametes sanguinea]